MDHPIVVQGLGKQFRHYHPGRPRTLQEVLLHGVWHWRATEGFWALRDVSFSIAPGHMVGVVGANGAGKSTLLRLMGGVGGPDAGHIEIRGRIGAFLELGAGLHGDRTGRENLYISGILAGL